MSLKVAEPANRPRHARPASVRAVDGIDFELRKGECFALVGESGCGKSMTALSLMRLLPEAGRIAAGRVELDGVDLLALPEAAMRAVRGRRVAMIFQEPSTALNPVLTVGRQIVEVHGTAWPREREATTVKRRSDCCVPSVSRTRSSASSSIRSSSRAA